MIDIHSHILFGVDDGAGNAEDSLIMAETAAENGVKQMIMTPHCCEADGFANFNTAELLARFDSMRAMMKENEIPLKLYNGMEVFSTPSVTTHNSCQNGHIHQNTPGKPELSKVLPR